METTIDLLRRLQIMDRQEFERRKAQAIAPGMEDRAELQAKAAAAARSERERQQDLARWRGAFRTLELDLRSAESHLRQDEKRLYSGETAHAKEIAQLEQRVEEEKRQRDLDEEKYLRLLTQIEDGERRVALAKIEAEKAKAALTAFDREIEGRLRESAGLAADYQAKRARLLEQIPEEYLQRYERIVAQHPGSALVSIVRETCGGCHNALARAEIERVTRYPGQTVCDNCGRLLVPEKIY